MTRPRSIKPELPRLLDLMSPVDRRVLAQFWGASSPDPAALIAVMTDPTQVEMLLSRLTDADRAALTRVLQEDGALPVAVLQREYGGVRESGGFEHPRAYLEALRGPATPTERLFSVGLIFRSHDERGAIYRIPNDLLPLLPPVPPRDRTLLVTPETLPPLAAPLTLKAEELVIVLLTLAYRGELKALDDGGLNKASLVKLARHMPATPNLRTLRRETEWPFVAVVRTMAVEAGLLRRTSGGELRPTAQALDWLKAPPAQRAQRLLNGWCISTLDDLTILCGLRWKGGAPYTLNRTATRRNLLRLFGTLPPATWLSIDAIVAEAQRVDPDFQRRDGRYDTWLLYDAYDRLVSSWEDWPLVEGALIRAALCQPLRWLGATEVDESERSVRLTALGAHLLADAPEPPELPPPPLIVQSTFEVLCPGSASPYARFQLGRFAELKQSGPLAIYALTKPALLAAAERGITPRDALRFLEEHAAEPLPPAVAYTIFEWGGQSDQVRLEDAVLLTSADPVVLAQIRAMKGLGLSNVEPLSPTLLRVPDGMADEVAEGLRRAGFGVRDERIDPHLPLDDRELRALVTAAVVYTLICAEFGLPAEITPALLQRVLKLAPLRIVQAAEQHAATLIQQIVSQTAPATKDTSGR